MWPFNKRINTTERAKTALAVYDTVGLAKYRQELLDIGAPVAAEVDQSRFAREERSTPGFHLNNINDIIASLETTRDHIAESICFEETRHYEEMNRLEIQRDNVGKSISGYMAARAVLTGETYPMPVHQPAPVDPARMTAVGERITDIAKAAKPGAVDRAGRGVIPPVKRHPQQIGRALRPTTSERVKIGDFIDIEGEQYQVVPKGFIGARRVRLDGRYHWISVHTVREPEAATTVSDADTPDKPTTRPIARVDQGSSGAIDIG